MPNDLTSEGPANFTNFRVNPCPPMEGYDTL